MRELDAVAVIVPAHNEQQLLGRCLTSVNTSISVLLDQRPSLQVAVVVVLDRCSDSSGKIARDLGARTVAIDAGSVGAARRTGVTAALGELSVAGHTSIWLAHTDADTVVPAQWLAHQVAAAHAGADLVIGRVRPDPNDLTPEVLQLWEQHHTGSAVDAHIHGANLGVRGEAYLRVGGFRPMAEHEDIALVTALIDTGAVAHHGLQATTSGRTTGRVTDGFSGYLRKLADHQDLTGVRDGP